MAGTPPNPMLSALQSMAKPAGGGAAPMAPGAAPPIPSATGAPSPLGIGKVPTGAGGSSPKVAVGTAINAMRDLKAQFPESAQEIDGIIATVRQYGVGGDKTGASDPQGP